MFSMPEDCPAFGGTNPNNNDPVVERVRRYRNTYFPTMFFKKKPSFFPGCTLTTLRTTPPSLCLALSTLPQRPASPRPTCYSE